MNLTGQQKKQLKDALIAAFVSKNKLEIFLAECFDKNLNAIAMGDDLEEIVFKLIRTAEAEGWVDKLIIASRQSKPGNTALFVFAQELNLSTAMPSQLSARGALERVIKKSNSFIDVNTWREKLGLIEGQVCRIEITKNNHFTSYGTGFLIAPDVVITNYHVIEPLITEKAIPSQVVLRFDYKQLGDGQVINKGTEYRLIEQDWLIDKSPYANNDSPSLDELDYALLRIDGTPGEDTIGKNNYEDAPARGWINLPTEPYEFIPETPLLIVQHPNAEPLKLAFDSDAIISINQSGTIVKYKTNTEPGSSGSPCFDINWNLVALHHSGDPIRDNPPSYNAGTPFSAICTRLKQQGLLEEFC